MKLQAALQEPKAPKGLTLFHPNFPFLYNLWNYQKSRDEILGYIGLIFQGVRNIRFSKSLTYVVFL